MSLEIHCYKCFGVTALSLGDKILRHEECDKCKASLHCCKMCQFYDTQAYNGCREPLAERILEKENPNFCSYFVLADGGKNKSQEKNELYNKANSLFKD